MSDPSTTPLPRDVIDALGDERARPGVDPATRARARVRLHASLLAGAGGQGSRGPDSFAGKARASAPRGGLLHAVRSAHPLVTAALGFAVGVTTGVAMEAHRHAADSRTPQYALPAVAPTVPSMPPAPVGTVSIGEQSTPSSTPPLVAPEVGASSRTPGVTGEPAPPVPSGSALTAERALLDVAHSALAKGQATDALVALGKHAQTFPHGVYREEREALKIQCLRALGRTDEATRLTTAFKTRYPRSLFLSIIEPEKAVSP